MFVVAHAPTEEGPAGQKAKYMETLNSTVVSVPTREHLLVLKMQTPGRGEEVR